MIEEPYRWVEAIATRRDYVETQLSSGSPIIALTFADGILLFTVGQQKLFEIYDRIALGAIGHPGDIERLRMAAIELASTEGFARSAADVSLRRLAYYSLSPVMKNAFEQIYGAPFLARLLFAEIGATPAEDLFLRVEYDGAISQKKSGNKRFAVLAPTKKSAEQMEQFLEREDHGDEDMTAALELAFDAWAAGQKQAEEGAVLPGREEIRACRRERLGDGIMEAVVLERRARSPVQYRTVEQKQLAALSEQV
ncbi:MAG: 20S proteasome subunit A/B [Verrucomicrobia bacterium]|nr:20S proteasome subunit A/B [Verrucomicrobiota bacterium]